MRKAKVNLTLSGTNMLPTMPVPDDLRARPVQLTDNARVVLQKRYVRRGEDGKPAETEQEMFWRVAYHVALAEAEFDEDVEKQARVYYDLLTQLEFFPNSPTFTGAGTPLGQLAACFTADMRVTTSRGLVRIADLQPGELVLTHKGRFRPVTQTYKRAYEGKLLRLRVKQIGTPIEVTPEHPILTQKGWVKAGELTVGDWVAVGAVQEQAMPVAFDLAALNIPVELEMEATSAAIRVRLAPVVVSDCFEPYAQIDSIDSEDFVGEVFNCEVEEDHTYVTEGVVVHNCFVLPIEDDMGRSAGGIFQTLRDAALIQQTGGGNGFAFSRLRPKGAIVKSSNGEATGPVGFLRVYDQAFGEIAQGGSRRGANMAVLKISHPDVRQFITCKSDESQITNFNISVGITDEFMAAVEADGDFNLINPQNDKVWQTVRARDLFDLIVKQAHHNGEPGVLFLDAANRANPVPQLYELESTNPCGEQFLGPYENCCLGSINLAKLNIVNGQPDWDHYQRMIETSTRFLDDVVTANSYVTAVPQLAEAAHRVRRIGLGIMGLGDLMYKLGVRYGSEEGQEFAGQVSEFLRYHAMRTSIELAKERGAFPAIEASIYDPANLKWEPPTPLFGYKRHWGRPTLDWEKIVSRLKKHGIRNGAQTTVAPTGTIATVSGCEAYGCEPVFALAYIRNVNDKGNNLQLQYTSPLFEQALHQANLSEERIKAIVEQVNLEGTCQNISDLPKRIRHTFVVSSDITAEEHIRMQAAMQKFIDNAISKTCNFPAGATTDDVAKAYMLGWKLGCKGLTVYVTGSRDKVVLETNATAKAKEEKPAETPVVTAAPETALVTAQTTQPAVPNFAPSLASATDYKKHRPRRLDGRTYRVRTPLGTTYITVNENGEGKGQPFELFLHTAKAGSETAAVSEAIGRLSSLILRLNSPVKPRERLKEIIDQLNGIGGGRSTGFGADRVRSLPDGVAQALQEYIEETYNEPTSYETPRIEMPDAPAPAPTSSVSSNGHSEGNPATAAGTVSAAEMPATTVATKPATSKASKAAGKAAKVGDLCPECGEASVVNEEGCRKCYSCGFSEC